MAILHESQGFFLYYNTAAESDMPSDARHHLLVALLGRTPQVLTETLLALCVDAGIPISEIWAISTEEGMKAALDKRWQDPKSTECPDLSH